MLQHSQKALISEIKTSDLIKRFEAANNQRDGPGCQYNSIQPTVLLCHIAQKGAVVTLSG